MYFLDKPALQARIDADMALHVLTIVKAISLVSFRP